MTEKSSKWKKTHKIAFTKKKRNDRKNIIPIRYQTNSLSKTVFSVKPLFKRFERFEKSLYGLKRPINDRKKTK